MLIVHLFVSYAHVNLCYCFSFSWYRGLAATSACGSSWTFLFTFFHRNELSQFSLIAVSKKAFLAVRMRLLFYFARV